MLNHSSCSASSQLILSPRIHNRGNPSGAETNTELDSPGLDIYGQRMPSFWSYEVLDCSLFKHGLSKRP